jgi:hypothetical protein
MVDRDSLQTIYIQVFDMLKEKGYLGYDPYDLLNSRLTFNYIPHKVLFLLSQVNKRSFINLRPFLMIKKSFIPKGKALIIKSILNMNGIIQSDDNLEILIKSLLSDRLQGYRGTCWGLPFEYADRHIRRRNNVGDIVATAYAHEALYHYSLQKEDQNTRNILLDTPKFIIEDLGIEKRNFGYSISYTTQKKNEVFNAICLASDIFIRTYYIDKNETYLEYAEGLLDYVVSFQEENGVFPYSNNNGILKYQTDFHQLYIINSLAMHQDMTGSNKYGSSIRKALEYYINNQIFNNGFIRWRYPTKYPVDIHNQAAAIYYLSKLKTNYQIQDKLIRNIVNSTIDNFYINEKKYFAYQKYPFLTNKVPYIRWSQAWMLLALSQYLKSD